MQIQVELPEKYFGLDKKEEITNQFKLYATLMMYKIGKVSAGMACEILNISRFVFLDYCKEFEIPVINYSIEDIEKELEGLI